MPDSEEYSESDLIHLIGEITDPHHLSFLENLDRAQLAELLDCLEAL